MYQSSPPPLPFPGEPATTPQPYPYASTSSQAYPYYAPIQEYAYAQPYTHSQAPRPLPRPLPQPPSKRSLPTVPQRYTQHDPPAIDTSSRPASYGAAVASLNQSPTIPQHGQAGPGPPLPPPRRDAVRSDSAPIPPVRHEASASIRSNSDYVSAQIQPVPSRSEEFGRRTDSPAQSISSRNDSGYGSVRNTESQAARNASVRSTDSFQMRGTDSLGRRKQWTSWDQNVRPVVDDLGDMKIEEEPVATGRQDSAPAKYKAPVEASKDVPSFTVSEEIPTFTVSEEPAKPDLPTFSVSEDKPVTEAGVPSFSFPTDDDSPSEAEGPSISFSVAPPTPQEQSTSEYFPKVLDPPSTRATPSAPSQASPQPQTQARLGLATQPTTTSLANDMLCGGCALPIAGKIVSAMKRRWHPDCFTCCHCSTSLEHVAFYEHDGMPYCHFDYHEKFSIRCYHCKTPIVDETYITLSDPALGSRTYHELHFFCSHCGDPFIDPKSLKHQPFIVHEGYAYCEECNVDQNKPKCFSCKKSIVQDVLKALGRIWHEDCFVCSMCEKPFEDPEFFTREDLPYCEECYRIKLRSDL